MSTGTPLPYLAEEDAIGADGEELTTMFVVNSDGSRRNLGSRPRGAPRCAMTKEEIDDHLFERWAGVLRRLAEDDKG